ncbi:hypothetical protein C5612_19510 [Pseudomonas frederiksbergensis]|jgi:hypothetical protein|uniref:Uncharacterized protein n=1 Tax=Pseudomonas frederiksbergensis TaxID=104087 RepID=A0A2S8HGC7_9PSED|nr:hypothetical protein C1X67_17180 [Pseudomonas sp. FW305-62]PNB20949.1 hypothetical protein C1X69_12930 [Pseudomonas sp. FW305-67]PQP01549.1 hypothetical protein C5612_19510 [Pseudomonas frederiksbergensis]
MGAITFATKRIRVMAIRGLVDRSHQEPGALERAPRMATIIGDAVRRDTNGLPNPITVFQ